MILAAITCVGLVLRLMLTFDLQLSPDVCDPEVGTDMQKYLGFAEGILRGELPSHFYYQPLYYTLFLPLVLFLSQGLAVGVGVVQAVLGAATIWLAGVVAARLFGRQVGLLAAALLAFAHYHVLYTPFMLMAVLQGFWIMLLLHLSLGAYERNRWWDWGGVALVLTASILTRGNALLLTTRDSCPHGLAKS
jgi:uncharacterized membrane protein